MKYQRLTILFVLFISTCFSLYSEQFWGMSGRKLENYFSQGFSSNDFAKTVKKSELKKVRAFFKRNDGYERIVFDLGTKYLPKTMVYLSPKDKNLVVKLYGTSLGSEYKEHKGTEMFHLYESYTVDKETLVVKMSFKRPKEVDVFYLENPARLVIDARVKKKK